jgi:hypothetical protein
MHSFTNLSMHDSTRNSPIPSTSPTPTPPSKKPTTHGIALPIEEEDTYLIDTLLASHVPNEIDPTILLENARRVAAADEARAGISEGDIAACGIEADSHILEQGQEQGGNTEDEEGQQQQMIKETNQTANTPRDKSHPFDLLAALSATPELFPLIAKYMPPAALLSLYSISRDFHKHINANLSSVLTACAAHQAPDSARLYVFKFYRDLCVPDPVGRAHPNPMIEGQVRLVPSLRWLSMVVYRERCVRDILACLARQGHRCPAGMSASVKKMWLVMDVATSAGRAALMHSRGFMGDMDLWRWQLFMVKLDMRFNDPIDGPGDDGLRKLMLGQKGLGPLCRLLRREEFLGTVEVVRAMVRYRYRIRPQHAHLPLFGVAPEEIGIGHLEGWGRGRVHLLRPDELVIKESVRRDLGLKHHVMEMMLWGYVDLVTGEDTPATEDEMYMSDDGGQGMRKSGKGWCDYKARRTGTMTVAIRGGRDSGACTSGAAENADTEMADG